MPKYFFDLMGKHVMRDRAGLEFSSDAAASREAIMRGANRRHPEAQYYCDFESILVRGTSGAIICAAPIRYTRRMPAPQHEP